MTDLHAQDPNSWLETIWDALHEWAALMDNHDLKDIEERWDDICTAMAWIDETIMEDSDDGHVTIETEEI